MDEPFSPEVAKALIRSILASGEPFFSKHALEKMGKADPKLLHVDCVNVLRGGTVEPAEWENGSWRYRVRTARIYVVVAFRSTTELTVVTTWRVNQ